MFHRKRFRSAIAIILTLLLVAALAPVASAQNGLPEPPAPEPPVDPAPTDPPPPPGPTATATSDNGTDPPPPPSPTATATATATPDNGMMNGDKDGDMMGTPSSHSWPPPNAIVRHAATPVQISAHGGALNVYFIAADGAVTSGPVIATVSSLADMHTMGAAVELFSGMNPGTGKSVDIHYLPGEMKIRVSTYYADKPPHDYNKPYVFTVDADHSVNHERW